MKGHLNFTSESYSIFYIYYIYYLQVDPFANELREIIQFTVGLTIVCLRQQIWRGELQYLTVSIECLLADLYCSIAL